MPDIQVNRPHALGLERARTLAARWIEDAEQRYDMRCTLLTGEESDTVEFSRTGASGRLVVAGDRFALDARLGFLLAPFATAIQAQIERNLDSLLALDD